MCSFWDVLPTFEEIIHPKAKQKEMDGVSMLPSWKTGRDRRNMNSSISNSRTERSPSRTQRTVEIGPHEYPRRQAYYELYNLASDPSERHNILDQYPEKVAELKDIMVREHRPDPNWPLLKEEKAK